jgi:hypothetical protein
MEYAGAQIKNPQGLTDPEDCTRNSSSLIPQPTRERYSTLQAGLLAHGSPYSPCLPIRSVKRRSSFVKRRRRQISYEIRFTRYVSRLQDSGFHGFRPHLQRRDREGFPPSSLTQESQCGGHSRRPGRSLSSSLMSVSLAPAHILTGHVPTVGKQSERPRVFRPPPGIAFAHHYSR